MVIITVHTSQGCCGESHEVIYKVFSTGHAQCRFNCPTAAAAVIAIFTAITSTPFTSFHSFFQRKIYMYSRLLDPHSEKCY